MVGILCCICANPLYVSPSERWTCGEPVEWLMATSTLLPEKEAPSGGEKEGEEGWAWNRSRGRERDQERERRKSRTEGGHDGERLRGRECMRK